METYMPLGLLMIFLTGGILDSRCYIKGLPSFLYHSDSPLHPPRHLYGILISQSLYDEAKSWIYKFIYTIYL